MSTTVYGKMAYEAFAKAIAHQMGLAVQLEAGAKACINKAGIITIPDMNTYQTFSQFEVTCGVIVHEMAHQFYNSHSLINPSRSALEHACLNALLDVSDETWVAEWFNRYGNTRPGSLLTIANRDALTTQHSALKDWQNANTHLWKVLCIGILSARLGRLPRWVRYTAAQAGKLGVDAKACFKIIRSARLGKGKYPYASNRTYRTYRWSRDIIAKAKKLAELLKPFEQSAQPIMIMGVDVAVGAGASSIGAGKVEASPGEGMAMAEAAAQAAGGNGAGGGDGDGLGNGRFDQAAYDMLAPAVAKIAQRLAIDGDGVLRDNGLTAGGGIGEAHRLFTDGRCMSRWHVNEHADGLAVSVVLDCSGSMRRRLEACAGIARAFAVGMRQAGHVQSIVFGNYAESSNDFNQCCDMGSTGTHVAIDMATKFLSKHAGEKWIVLITDGSPDNESATDAAADAAVAAGIKILCIGLGGLIPMRQAKCVVAADVIHLAIELEQASYEIAR